MSQPAGKPKPAFFVAVLVVIAALVGLAVVRCTKKKGGDEQAQKKDIDLNKIKEAQNLPKEVEAVDPTGITTVKEYEYKPSEKLPEVKGSAAYDKMKDRTVRFAINVWAGWAPIIHANEGFKAKKEWKDAKGQPFKVELVVADDPVAMRDALAAGKLHVGWATVDMIPLFVEGLKKDPRTMPRIYQQVDWSNGGDGIVVRDSIKTAADLKGKTIVLAQNSPSHYFLLNVLLNSGIQPRDVNFKYTGTAFEAAAAFVSTPSISAVVSWAPDIYNIPDKVAGTKILVTTKTANKLIADVWFARADFGRDNPDIIEGLVRGIFDSTAALEADDAKQAVSKWMADGFGLPASDALGMLGDAHWTNYAENREFFLNANNAANFERTYNMAHILYKEIGVVEGKVDYSELVDFSILQTLGKEEKYKKQKSNYDVQFAPVAASAIQLESTILTKTVVIQFFPNSADLYKKVDKQMSDGTTKEGLYDPNVDFVIEEVAKLAAQYGAARILIEGHTDGSMKGTADPALVKELSSNRANAVKQALINKFKLDPNQLVPTGIGWDRPADPADPANHAKNRRVEVRVVPAEAQ
jgi:NitT/TauT family transport system substrate-binding protein